MGCCSCGDDEENDKKLEASADFQGPAASRSCTDCLCMLVLVACWVAMTGLGYTGITEGQYEILDHGWDYQGNICGVSDGYTDKPYLYYVNIDLQGVCVDECPTEDGSYLTSSDYYCAYDVTLTALNLEDEFNKGRGRCLPKFESKAYNGRCLPVSDLANFTLSSSSSSEDTEMLADSLTDIWTAKDIIFGCGFVIAIVASFGYLFVLRIPCCVTIVVWSCLFLVEFLLLAIGGYSYTTYVEYKESGTKTDNAILGMQVISILFLAAAFLWFCLMCFFRKRIGLAIVLVKEAAKAIIAVPAMLFWPFAELTGLVLFMVPWVAYSIFIATMGDFNDTDDMCNGNLITPVCTSGVKAFSYSDTVELYAWYMLFIFFWTTQFIVAMGEIVIAMTIAKWFFAREPKEEIGNVTLFSSVFQSFYYHMGTAAFGSFIIAVIKLVRAAVEYAQKQVLQMSKGSETAQKIATVLFCILRCCLWCLEKIMRFVNRNAYVQTAIYGTPFLTSAKKAFFLIARNIARIAAVSVITDFVLVIGKLFIMSLSALVCYVILTKVDDYSTILSSPWGPVLFVMLISWFTAELFCIIFSMAMTTLLQCFVADEEMGTGFASEELREFIDNNGAKPDSKPAASSDENANDA